ncbi:MAG: multidrug transporter MatE, partial [Spirochaetales bacterium]|nr:multidrug transporter MatE [Spirochaetales bacterium]
AMGVLTILFNRQIIKYISSDALAVYGVIINISTIIHCCGYSIGQAGQPLVSTNFARGKMDRVQLTLFYMIITAFIFGLLWTVSIFCFPLVFLNLFMKTTEQILAIGPTILRTYGLSFLLIPFNVFSTYYFQSIMRPGLSLLIASARGLVISSTLILLLPLLFSPSSLWLAMPLTELIVALFVVFSLKKHRT